MTFGSVCDGIGCGHLAFEQAGMDCSWAFEIEPFPSAVLAERFPEVPNHGDMNKCAEMILSGKIDAPDVFIGGTPCFAGDHMVLTELGYWPIKDVYPGCSVVTHTGRLCKVVRAGAKKALVGSLKGIGLGTIRCTSEHPFRSVAYRNQSTKRNNRYAKVEHIGEPEWTAAKDMPGKQWCALTSVAVVPASPLPSCVTEDEAMYLAGFYLGDGWIRKWGGKNKKAVVFGINEAKLVKLRACVTSVHLTIGQERTGPRATICNTELAEWLLANFGRYSYGKTLPPWVLSHRLRGRLVQGYRDTDGGVTPSGWKAISTSRSLAYGMRDLVQTLGSVGSVMFHESPKTTVIEGRTVKQRNYWLMHAYDNDCSRKSRVRKGMLLRSVTSYEIEREETVYNIEVEGDNSYILDGAIVHNCQAFSVAGKRKGLEDARGNLSLTFCTIADAIDARRKSLGLEPCAVLWENVPGVLSDKGNAFGCFLGELSGAGCQLQPPGGRWRNAGCVFGPERTVAWRVLDSQFFGVAQRRRRVFVVASAGDRCRPEEILFEREGVRRDSPPSREAWEGVTNDLAPSLTSSGRGVERTGESRGQDPVVAVWPEVAMPVMSRDYKGPRNYQDGGLQCAVAVAHSIRAEGHDASEDGTGRGTPVVAFSCKDYGNGTSENLSPTLRAMEGERPNGGGQMAVAFGGDIARTLSARHDSSPCADRGMDVVATGMQVRRLLPSECEALQGLPRNWTLIPWRNKPAADCPDGPRYKGIGNGQTVNVMRWLAKRIRKELEQGKEVKA